MPYPCRLCQLQFDTWLALTLHYEKEHTEQPVKVDKEKAERDIKKLWPDDPLAYRTGGK